MKQSYFNVIQIFFKKTSNLMANFFLLLILYNYFFVRNNSNISITYKELYIIVFVSIILGIFSLPSKNADCKIKLDK
ncbi:hypothetical protein SAMN05878443_0211 [Carnobacterium alterfunditum]|uniref:Uncharacterized protein n=1 Tax=Carnobacterium alterfunditum TaxID=28230 RepID=A0A1N6EUM8_9LACT|nr:hypothetical protein SAMN05878443_0211 [Carnobacterium alterfunditum]